MIDDLIRLVMGVGNDTRRSEIANKVHRVVDQRLARDADQRFGFVLGQGSHPRAKPGGKEHYGVWHHGAPEAKRSGVGSGNRPRIGASRPWATGVARLFRMWPHTRGISDR